MATALLGSLSDLRTDIVRRGQLLAGRWDSTILREEFRQSALNLACYLALRQHDLRDLQTQLMPWGLSSLGRSESRVLDTLDSVIATLSALCTQSPREAVFTQLFFRGDDLLEAETERVLGPEPAGRRVRIMVTFPTQAAEDYGFVLETLRRGMNVARINCAHDSPVEWLAMVENVRRAERETGLSCKIAMDLGGPKIRVEKTTFEKRRRFKIGETVLLARDQVSQSGESPLQFNCTLRVAVEQVKVGDEVWIDDGLIGARVEALLPEGALLRIEQTAPDGERIRPEKGINFPDTDLHVAALTAKDLLDLDFVAEHADIVDYSFVQTVEDVHALQSELQKRIGDANRLANLAVVAKIETRRAVQNLPELIIAAAGVQPFGVMIARGDLAVEIGFERLAEMQEEMLWLCEAAHVPVIWATQVFENFVKTGVPTRAEVTDAAMSERAECVMLNKGKYVADAVELLDHVIVRMQGHQFKKRAELRALKSWPIPELSTLS